jgi:hypothetical protein
VLRLAQLAQLLPLLGWAQELLQQVLELGRQQQPLQQLRGLLLKLLPLYSRLLELALQLPLVHLKQLCLARLLQEQPL